MIIWSLALAVPLALGTQDESPKQTEPVSQPDQPEREGGVARLTRLADPVALLDGEARVEKMLFYWEKSAMLRVGDGVRQGVAGFSEVFFPDDRSEIRSYGETHLTIEPGDSRLHVVRFQDLSRTIVELRDVRTRLLLPGGTTLEAENTWIRVGRNELGGSLIIRNAGPSDVHIEGPVVPVGVAALAAGHEVRIPLVEKSPVPAEDEQVDTWENRLIRLGPGVQSTKTDMDLHLDGEGFARVGGARIRIPPGGSMRVWRPRP